MSRKLKICLGVVILLLVGLGTVLIIGVQSEPTAKQVETKETSIPFTGKDAQRLEEALNSSKKQEQAKALVPDLRDGQWSSSEVLPSGAKLKINHESFTLKDDGTGTVNASVSGSVEDEFTLHLALVTLEEDSRQWLVFMSEEVN